MAKKRSSDTTRTPSGRGSRRIELSVVVPLFNEGPYVAEVFDHIERALRTARVTYEIILIVDGSEDDTWNEPRRLAGQRRECRAIGFSRNFGKEAALSAGIDEARGDAVIIMDGDLEHPPELIPRMVEHWRSGKFDIVEAVKTRRSGGPLRRFRARAFYAVLRLFSGIDLRGTTDFKLLDRSVVRAYQTMPERNLFFRGMVYWLGFRRMSVPFEVPERIGGETRWSVWKLISLALLGVTAYTTYPLRLITVSGFLFFVFAVGLSLQTLYNWFIIGVEAGAGFATVIILILITGSAIMMGLGIIGEYLARIYEELKQRPRYVVARRED